MAYEGKGEQKTGDWCRFCRAKPTCQACADEALALVREEFADLDAPEPVFKQPATIPLSKLEEVLPILNRVSAWIEAVFEYLSFEAIRHGIKVKGYKVVEGRSYRVFKDLGAVVKPRGKLTFVPESDPRAAVEGGDTAQDFEILSDSD